MLIRVVVMTSHVVANVPCHFFLVVTQRLQDHLRWSMMNIVGNTKVIYIRVKVEESWGPIHPLVDLAFGLVKIGPKLDNWFLKLGILS